MWATRRLLYLISLVVILSAGYVQAKTAKDVIVFWIPPEIETCIPVNAEDVERRAFKVVQVKNEAQADRILKLIQKSDQEVNPNRIRIRISTGDKFYDFDSNGIGISSVRESVRIDLKKLKLVLCE